jgi:uncharacterized protein (TIGR02646 family)
LEVSETLLYKDFNRTGELRKILESEQHHVCCYCQRPVTAFRIEHSYPERGLDQEKSTSLQLEYTNLFASCIDSQRLPKNLQYCDVAKGNSLIREFIKEEECVKYFRYLSTGEVVPNGNYYTLKEYEEADDLTTDEKDALQAIKVLNLNCATLRDERKKCVDALLSVLGNKSNEEWQVEIKKWLESETFPPFIELRLQYINKYLQ